MSDLFLFRFKDDSNQGRQSIVVFGANEIVADDLEAIVKKDVSMHLTPSKIYIIGLSSQQEHIKSISSNTHRIKILSTYISEDENCIEFIGVTADGVFNNLKTSNILDEKLKNKILQAGGVEIFKKRNGLLTSSSHYHFIKPSGAHCDKFIRVSNLLTSGNEVAFMALGLLPHITDNMKHIYVDTSSISFLIMTALQLSDKYQNNLPVIESFESYAALNKKYDFVEASTTTVFISATTSGGLVAKLERDTNLYKDRMFTMFFSKLGKNQNGLFDISTAMDEDIYSEQPENCKYCKENSKLISIVGEQFLPETPRHESFLIRKPHFSKDRAKFFKDFSTHGLLHWNKVEGQSISEHFFIDIAKFLATKELPDKFIEQLDVALNKSFSRDIKTVITLDDDGSRALTQKVKNYVGTDASNYAWISLPELEGKINLSPNSVLVVSGSITSGRKLLSASRKLRVIDKNSSIKYLVGISKLPNKETMTQLKSDLQQGGHELIILKSCPLPRVKEHVITAWDLEKSFLNQANDPFSQEKGIELTEILKQRVDTLDSGNTQNGLFLTKVSGEPLKLRDSFAFWSDLDIDCSKASQADVYWTIQAIIHDLRLNNADSGLESTYHSTVLSPICFDRYNDGVIQACLLRSATSAELDYTINEHFSRQMTDVLISIIENWDNDQGEGCLEFLMALATNRMKVLPSDLLRVLDLIDSTNMDRTIKLFLGYIACKNDVEIKK